MSIKSNFKSFKLVVIAVMLLPILSHASVYASTNAKTKVVRLFDTGEPIALTIPVNQEIELSFAKEIKSIGISHELMPKLQSQSIDKHWWIVATDSFNAHKVLVKDVAGRIIVFLISTIDNTVDSTTINRTTANTTIDNTTTNKTTANTTNITTNIPTKYQVLSQNQTSNVGFSNNSPNLNKNNINNKTKPLTLIDLTRFAAQVFYAPKRLIKDIGLNRVAISTNKLNLFACQDLLCPDVQATPLASWRDKNSNERYVSAIQIKNLGKQSINLDPRLLIGNFICATFQFNRIGAHDSSTDTTVLYVVTRQPLGQSL